MKKKIKIGIIAVIVIAVVLFILNLVFRYFFYDKYKNYLSSYEVEKGKEFVPIEESKSDITGMELVAQNDNFKLYTNVETTEIAIVNKTTGDITYSNPQNREEDTIASITNKSELNSTLVVEYYNEARNGARINNYDMSIQYKQYTMESINDGIRYTYTLEEPDTTTGIVPLQISEQRFQTLILDKLSSKQGKTVKGKYKLKDGIYKLLDKAMESAIGMEKLNALFVEAGYTQEDQSLDMGEAQGKERMSFTIPLEYRLTQDGIEVSVPTSGIIEKGGAKIYRLELLKFLGAGGPEAKGYMVVPNGSGSIIEFNNGKTKDPSYSQYVYDLDPVTQSYVVIENTETARLPVFGIKNNNTSIFAVIENGDALACIDADVAGKLNTYNYVYVTFSLREMELLNMFGVTGTQADTPVLEKNIYDVNLKVSYTLLSGDQANYSGMANYYREKLIAEGVLQTSTTNTLPFYLDILGGVETHEHIVGIPKRKITAMTTFDQAGKIVEELFQNDITNIRMNYMGWFNRGVYHDVPDKINVLSTLGGKRGMEKLSNKLEGQGGKLFGDVAFQKVTYTSKRFQYKLESSKYYSGYVVNFGVVNPASLRQTSTLGFYRELAYDVMSPKFLPRYVTKFSNKVNDINITGVGLRDLGSYLASDKKRTEVINRQMAKEIVKAQVDLLQKTGKQILVDGGNLYSLQYTSDIISAPITDSSFFIIDRQIPFYEMVIHGNIDYTGKPINLSDAYDKDNIVLQYIEYGVAPRFTFSYEDSSKIKYTSSAEKYSIQYKVWMEDAVSIYTELSGALNPVVNSNMISHEVLPSNLIKVRYDNGIVIYVNKTSNPITDDGVTVEATGYVVKEGVIL